MIDFWAANEPRDTLAVIFVRSAATATGQTDLDDDKASNVQVVLALTAVEKMPD